MTQRLVALGMGVLLLAGAVRLGGALANRSAPYDDAFITFRYARNFAEGQGFVYNPGQPYLGTTSPGYGLLLGATARVTGWDPAQQANWLSAFAIAVMAWFGFALVRRDFGQLAGITAGLSIFLNPMIVTSWGGEWLLAAAAMAAGYYFYRMERLTTAAVALSLAILFRSETMLGAVLICADALLKRKPGTWRAIGVTAAIGLAWIVLAGLVIGQVLPGTLGTKLAHGRSGLFEGFLRGFARGVRQFLLADYRMWLIALLAWHGVLVAALKGGVWRLIGLWLAAHVAFFTLFGFPFYHWYLVPLALGISLSTGIGITAVSLYLTALLNRRVLARIVTVALAVVMMGTVALSESDSTRVWIGSKPDPREILYNNAGAWLANRTPPDASVCYLEIGRIGYFSKRRLIDLMGLVTPEVAGHVANQDLLWAVSRFKPDYYLVGSIFTWAGTAATEPWFPSAYEEIEHFRAPGLNMVLTVYRKLPGAVFPEPPVIEGLFVKPNAVVGEILPGASWSQTFVANRDNLYGVATTMATFARVNRGTMSFKLEMLEPLRVVHEEQFRMEDVADNQWRTFSFPALVDSRGKQFRFTISAVDSAPGNAVTLFYNARDLYPAGERYLNGVRQKGDMPVKLVYLPGS